MPDGIDEMLEHISKNDAVELLFRSQHIPVEAVQIGLDYPVQPRAGLYDELWIQFYSHQPAVRQHRTETCAQCAIAATDIEYRSRIRRDHVQDISPGCCVRFFTTHIVY